MFGCLKPFFSAPNIAADLEVYPKKDGSFTGVVWKRQRGQWWPRLAELSLQDELCLYKTCDGYKKYQLDGMTKLLLGAGQHSTHAKMTLKGGEKLYLKIKGPDRNEWAARITQCRFPSLRKKEEKETEPEEESCNTLDMWSPVKYLTDSSSIYSSVVASSFAESMESTQQPLEEDEDLVDETVENNGLITQMARVFEPTFVSRKGTIRRLPEKVVFVGEAARAGVEIKSQLKITNKSDTKQAYKVKCTRNDLFRIRPATGILDYNQTAIVALSYRSSGEPVEEEKLHFGIYHIPAPEGCTCEGAWAEHYGPAQGELRLRVTLQQ